MVETLVAAAIFVPAAFYFLSTLSGMRKNNMILRETQVANAYGAELLEFFLAIRQPALTEWLKTNPFNAALAPHRLCSHINILDRANNVIVNNHPIADFPPDGVLGRSLVGPTRPNRFYMIQVVDATTMVVNKAKCAQRTSDVGFSMAPNERFLVSVGVSWLSTDSAETDPRRIIVSGLTPP